MRTKIILILAVLMGLVTTVLFYKYMKQYDQEKAYTEQMVTIVTASRGILKDEIIHEGMLSKVQVPAKGLHADVLRSSVEAVGKIASAAIAEGEPLMKLRLSDQKEEAMFVSRKVQEGYRAVSVSANFVQSVSNLIEPEDYVDVIVSYQDPVSKELVSEQILSKVRVLAVGRRMIESDADTEYAEYSAATLELKPEQALTAVHGDEMGNITLTLHSRITQGKGGE